MTDKRIRWIDEARGAAMLFVVLGHVIGGVSADLGGGEDNILRNIIYSFHMPLMFIISGIVGGYSRYIDLRSFFLKIIRLVVSLYIPYLLWGYLFWATKYFIYSGNEGVTLMNGKELFWNYTGWGPGWYLLTLLFIRVTDLVLDSFINNIKVKTCIWLSLFILGGVFGNIYLISLILKFGIYYQIGKAVKDISLKEHRIINCKNCLMLLCITSVFRFAGDLNYIMDFGIAVSISFLIILLFSQSGEHSVVMETIGGSSMVIYVLHAYMTIPVRIILQKYNVQDFAVYVIAETGSAILCSLVVIKCMDRFKWIKALFYPSNVLKKRSS